MVPRSFGSNEYKPLFVARLEASRWRDLEGHVGKTAL